MKPIIAIVSDIIEGKKEEFFVFSDYVRAVEEAGGFPVILPYNRDSESFLKKVDGVLLVGGNVYFKNKKKYSDKPLSETNPKRYYFESRIISIALKRKIPLMGICRGAQMIAERVGGKLVMDVFSDVKERHAESNHDIDVKEDSVLFELFKRKTLHVNSFHTKMISLLPYGYKITSMTPEDWVVESFESSDRRVLGFQFHPERLSPTMRKKIFGFFVHKSKKH